MQNLNRIFVRCALYSLCGGIFNANFLAYPQFFFWEIFLLGQTWKRVIKLNLAYFTRLVLWIKDEIWNSNAFVMCLLLMVRHILVLASISRLDAILEKIRWSFLRKIVKSANVWSLFISWVTSGVDFLWKKLRDLTYQLFI